METLLRLRETEESAKYAVNYNLHVLQILIEGIFMQFALWLVERATAPNM
jgi:hypothetical protein